MQQDGTSVLSIINRLIAPPNPPANQRARCNRPSVAPASEALYRGYHASTNRRLP